MAKKSGAGASYQSFIGQVIAHADQASIEALEYAASLYEEEWLRLIGEPKTGRSYKVTKTGALHQASAPGEPPAVDTGRLRGAYAHKVVRRYGAGTNRLLIGLVAGVNVIYAWYLEYGTSNMEPRPLWRPALEKIQGKLLDLFRPRKF